VENLPNQHLLLGGLHLRHANRSKEPTNGCDNLHSNPRHICVYQIALIDLKHTTRNYQSIVAATSFAARVASQGATGANA
jgi:hypothetical protein